MPTLKLRFPGGRYHATPWGHHVNEGLIEWPPSPWRLLRALIACGFATQHWREVPPLGRSLIEKLASEPPKYKLPQVTAAHSRHFMPVGELAKGRERTTLVWDTFANVGSGEVFVHWPCELNSDETAMLAQLANRLNYLGRSESWVEAELIPDASTSLETFNAVPHQQGEQRGQRYEQISLMAPIPADSYTAWQKDKAESAIAHLELPKGKAKPSTKLLNDRAKLQEPFPPDLVACLTKDTSWWKGHGWSQPPGSQRVLYWRPSQPMQVTVPLRPRHRPNPPVEMMLLAITTPSGNKSALPSVTRTLPQAELFHRAVVGRLAKGGTIHCPELTGKDEHGRPLRDNHTHSHTLPVDLDCDGRLDHIIIYAQMGLGDAAQRAIRTLRRTWTKGGVGDLQIAVVGHGDLKMLRQLPPPFHRHVEQLLGPIEGSRVWESITPFVLPCFLKRRGKNTLAGQINTELASRQLPEVENAVIDADLTRKLRHYVRKRSRGAPLPPVDIGYGVRLEFARPLRGPLTFGYGSHYGMGMFRALPEANTTAVESAK
jgi:CRISPR-associated protein Csb2